MHNLSPVQEMRTQLFLCDRFSFASNVHTIMPVSLRVLCKQCAHINPVSFLYHCKICAIKVSTLLYNCQSFEGNKNTIIPV